MFHKGGPKLICAVGNFVAPHSRVLMSQKPMLNIFWNEHKKN